MDKLRVRVYNVRFGDAILITVPDKGTDGKTVIRHILIDVGNAFSGAGGLDDVFNPVVNNILEELNGRGVDLYIMTHEHMDHVQGLLYANKKGFPQGDLSQKLQVEHAWLTASSAPDYYEKNPQAKKKKSLALQAYDDLETLKVNLAATKEPLPEAVLAIMEINNPSATQDCVDYLRNLSPKTWYVYRGFKLDGKHNFQEARLEIWAPEQDTSDYYGSFQPVTLGFSTATPGTDKPTTINPIPPPGVDAQAFYNLFEARKNGWGDNLLAIDQAANNTSIVFSLEWRGWRLLFAADAEIRSWQTMDREKMLKPVDFLKVGHHGSHNATPPEELLEKILPKQKPAGRQRSAAVSTYENTYSGVPEQQTLDRIKARCQLKDTRTLADAEFLDFEFPG
ncbi:MAG: ComEC/Rec2 family competence protein [Desulfobaccales bacterium]